VGREKRVIEMPYKRSSNDRSRASEEYRRRYWCIVKYECLLFIKIQLESWVGAKITLLKKS
jgi:hypothetical protein